MKVKFWKHSPLLFILWPIITLSILTLCVVGIILNDWIMLTISLISALVCILLFFFNRQTLSRIMISNEGIEWKWMKKSIMKAKWRDITEVRYTPHGRGTFYLTFVIRDKKIDIDLTKKMYKAIMELCPYDFIKTEINSIECIKWFNRKDNQK